MAKAKCKWCREAVDTKTAYKVEANGKNHYFCSEQHYNLAEQKKAEEDKIKAEYDEIFEITKVIFGYEFMGYALLKREVIAWGKVATRQKIIAYLNENKEWLSQTMSREFNGDYNRVRYYSVVVSSKLHDWRPKVVEQPKIEVIKEEHYETKYKPKARQALMDFEEDCYE